MNILLVSTNRNRQPVPVMPFGACLVAQAAEKAGHSVRFLDCMFKLNPLRALADELEEHPPDVIGISLRNIDNNDMLHPRVFYNEVVPCVQLIKKKLRVPVVLGGAAVALMPEQLMRHTGIDLAVVRNGEDAFPRLLAVLAAGQDYEALDDIAHIEHGVFHQHRRGNSSYGGESLVTEFDKWLDLNTYRSWFSTVPFQTKRGCPYNCVYCTYHLSEGNEYRLCSPRSAAQAIIQLTERGMTDIELVDSVFNSPYDHALSFCEEVARAGVKARLQTLELNPAFLDDTLLAAMERAGFVGIGVTAESAADGVLAALGKGYTGSQVRSAAQAVGRHALPCFWMFLMGGPGETVESVRDTIRFAERYVRPQDSVFFNIGIRIYPGTKLESIARKEGVLSLHQSEMLAPVTYLTPDIDPGWIMEEVRAATKKHLNFISLESLRLPGIGMIFRAGRFFGMTHPLWKYTVALRRGLQFIE